MEMRHSMNKFKRISIFLLTGILLLVTLSCVSGKKTDYSNPSLWAVYEENPSNEVDVFFIAPTSGHDPSFNMKLDDEDYKAAFTGATNMEKGIYDENARFFAPYYQQADLSSYALDNSEEYLSYAYEDVKAAFQYYLDYYNEGRPFIIAGF